MDGKLKNLALQSTAYPYKIQLDMDEYIPSWQFAKGLWQNLAFSMTRLGFKASMVPVVNLYGAQNKVSSVNNKWYLHRAGMKRGVFPPALRPDGTHDITMSDGCELLEVSGQIPASYQAGLNQFPLVEEKLCILQTSLHPYVVHTGYLSLCRRDTLNKNFWAAHWATENGKEVPMPTKEKLQEEKTYQHFLDI